jgi:hypothetical protein
MEDVPKKDGLHQSLRVSSSPRQIGQSRLDPLGLRPPISIGGLGQAPGDHIALAACYSQILLRSSRK